MSEKQQPPGRRKWTSRAVIPSLARPCRSRCDVCGRRIASTGYDRPPRAPELRRRTFTELPRPRERIWTSNCRPCDIEAGEVGLPRSRGGRYRRTPRVQTRPLGDPTHVRYRLLAHGEIFTSPARRSERRHQRSMAMLYASFPNWSQPLAHKPERPPHPRRDRPRAPLRCSVT